MPNSQIETQDWKEMSAVQIGGAICLPMILIGFTLARQNIQTAICAIAIGNLVLFMISLMTAEMSYESKRTTAENAALYFGPVGKAFFAVILTLSMCAWFAIQSQVMTQDIQHLLPNSDPRLIAMFVSLAIVLATLKGIRAVVQLARIALPLMGATLFCCLLIAYQQQDRVAISTGGNLVEGISLVIGAAILAVVDLPTFFRHARTRGDAIKASMVTFLVGMPLVELVGVLLGAWTSAHDLNEALSCFGHVAWKAWIWLFILIVGWTTNNANLYSGAMSMQALLPKLSTKWAIFSTGLLAVVLSACNLLGQLTLVLELMGISVASMGASVLAAYFLKRRHVKIQCLAWILGLCGGLMHLADKISLTPIAIVDAGIVSSIVIFLTWGVESEKICTN